VQENKAKTALKDVWKTFIDSKKFIIYFYKPFKHDHCLKNDFRSKVIGGDRE